MAADFDWPVTAGDTETLEVNLSDLAYDAGRVWTCEVRRAAGLAGVADAVVSAVGQDDGAGAQRVLLSLTPEQTRSLGNLGRAAFVWDLQVDEAGVITTAIGGTLTLTQDVTR